MRTFLQTFSAGRRLERHVIRATVSAPIRAIRRRLASGAADEQGFLLIEVIVSALMVALIVVGTFNGFDVASRISADQRRHDQAALLAAQSQEELRSKSAAALTRLVSNPREYTAVAGGTTYKIVQEAKPVGSTGTVGCSSSSKNAGNFQISSSVTWALLEKTKRPAVKEVGVVTPPTGSAIEVDDTDGTGKPVSGVTARVTFIPLEAGSYNTVEGTTGSTGCVILQGIPATSATVEVLEKSGFVTPSGALKVTPTELTIAPNIVTHDPVEFAEAGQISATFTYLGKTTYEGKTVVGDTFVASQTEKMLIKPENEVGSTAFKYLLTGEEPFQAQTGTYAATASTAAGSRYPKGDLYDFATNWVVWGGDCAANNIGAEAQSKTENRIVVSGNTTKVEVPLAYTKLKIWTGTNAAKGEATKESLDSAKVTNTGCKSAEKPNNSYGLLYTHTQGKTVVGGLTGSLEDPFQPFGSFELCVGYVKGNRRFTVPFTNAKASVPSEPQIYLGQKTTKEQNEATAKLVEKETALNNAETAAATAKTERENAAKTEASEKTTREAKEKTERTTWEAEEKAVKGKKITNAERKAKEASQTTTRKNIEKEEAAEATKRANEETEANTAKTKRAGEKTTLATEKTNLAKEQTKENESGVAVEAGSTCP